MKKRCGICGENKDLSEFNKHSHRADGLQSHCRDCGHIRFKEYYRLNHEKQLKIVKKRKAKVTAENKRLMLEYLKTHPCVDCGEKDIVVLDFDHLRDKDKNVSQLFAQGHSWERIEKEINKCAVRCANCHRRKTSKEQGNWKMQG
jgi:hypothetical protein